MCVRLQQADRLQESKTYHTSPEQGDTMARHVARRKPNIDERVTYHYGDG